MNGNLLILIELAMVFILVFGWGFHELRELKEFKRAAQKRRQDGSSDR